MGLVVLFVALLNTAAMGQLPGLPQFTPAAPSVPPQVRRAQRFLQRRSWRGQTRSARLPSRPGRAAVSLAQPQSTTSTVPAWQPLGPNAVTTPSYGLVTGRVTSIAFDPADSTGNRVFLGTTGGGLWLAQNADTTNPADVVFSPLTDNLSAMSTAVDASISIGAVSVQPGGTGVVLAGTGDPNDALDSYYGAGVLRSTDGGKTWSLIQTTTDVEQGLGIQDYSFVGEGFAGFAWSTASPQLVVAAVSQAYEGTLVDAERPNISYEGLYYSTDSGASWHLARITDPGGADVQGPLDAYAYPHGNAATAIVWNPARQIFVAAVRYHGYYQSTDGANWTRMTVQPGTGLTTQMCPTNPGSTGSTACPIFRGTLAVNPVTGDTFAWTVDANNQDQGIWQDVCSISAGTCTNQTAAFTSRWSTSALEMNTAQGATTIQNGDYNLALAAVPSGQDTLLLAGANDLWKCSLAMGCVWRNSTNAFTCMSAQVGPYQHALAWNPANPQEVFAGNDSGLWRSLDDIGETGQTCSATDATHFQNLNGAIGSLAEVESMSQVVTSPYTMMTGLGVNGTAGVKSTSGPTTDWPQILGGEGGPVAIDPSNSTNWYVNNGAGVSIHLCSQTGDCTASAFGTTPIVNNADVGGDGDTMTEPAPFLVDPLDPSQLLVGTCRVWRGPANGSAWTGSNAISPMLDGISGSTYCSGNALIRTMAALRLSNGSEVIFVGMYGATDGGANLAGHVLSATFEPSSGAVPVWKDVTLNPVTNDTQGLNAYALDISSIYIDPHDATGNTVYVTVEGIPSPTQAVRALYRSTDGGAHWAYIASNLPASAANSIVVDPQDANTAYVAMDSGVYSTHQVSNCATAGSNCWSAYGAGLPEAPVVGLSAAPAGSQWSVLAASTYGRGVWQIPLWTAATQLTTASATPSSLTFGTQADGTTSSPQTVTLTNTGGIALIPTAVSATGDFSETDNCIGASVNAGGSCTIQVTFTPTQSGSRTGTLTISANVAGGQLTVALSGTGESPTAVSATPAMVDFGQVEVGTSSTAMQVTLSNTNATAIAISGVVVPAPFVLASNACGSSLAANSSCQLNVEFAPTQTGSAAATMTITDDAGTQAVALSGTGAAVPTDTLSPSSLVFSGTVVGQLSPAQAVTLTNSGGVALSSIAITVAGPFQASSNCGTQLAAGSSCAISVVFAPTATGAATGSLTVADALRSQTVALSGTGLQPPAFSVSPSSLAFAAQQVATASAPATLTISNSGGASMANVGFQMTGQNAASFATGTTTCGATLSSGSSCTVQVLFQPTVAGSNTATLTISSSTLGVSPAAVPLSGTGSVSAGLSVSPAQMTFAEAVLGQASAAQTATITNTSSVSASGLTVGTTAPFSLTQNTCGTTIAAGASCSVSVVFTPTSTGTVTGALTVSSSTLSQVSTILMGTAGLIGQVQAVPSLLSFPTTGVSTTSPAQTVTLSNTSAVTLTALSLSASSGFQIATNSCPASLDPGASCTAAVVFAPTSAGQQTGNVTVASSAMASSMQIPLSGMGFDYSTGLAGSSSETVASGQTASFTVVLTPLQGSTGTFTYQCGSLPARASCVFNPASLTVPANAAGNMTLQIVTGQSASASVRPATPWRVFPVSLAMALLPLAFRRRRKNLFLALIFLGMTVGLSSCSGAGGIVASSTPPGNPGSSVTPAGTYSIPVTVSADGVSHQVSVSLTVD